MVLAGVVPEKRGWAGRLGRGIGLTLLVLAAMAGTELGLIAMLAIVVYGIVRAVRIFSGGEGMRRSV